MFIDNEEVFVINHPTDDEKCLLYAPLRSFACIAPIYIGRELEKGSSTLTDLFLAKLREKPLYNIRQDLSRRSKILPSLSISITNDCNLRCEYCYFSAGECGMQEKQRSMSPIQIKAAIDAYFSELDRFEITEADNLIHVSFAGGGEPMTHFDLVKEAIDYIRSRASEKHLTAHFNMPTNGMYDDVKRQFITDNFKYISLSMDGPEDIQNIQRPTKQGEGSFSNVKRTADFFFSSELKFAFRVTVTDYSVNRLQEVLDFFNDNYPGVPIDMEPMSFEGRSCLESCRVSPPDRDVYSICFQDALQYANRKGILLKNASVGKFTRLRPYFCQAVGIPCWTVTVDGRLTSCTRDTHPSFTFGVFDRKHGGFVIENDAVSFLRSQNVFEYPECSDCFMKYNCAGDCLNRRLNESIDCNSNRTIGVQILMEKLKGGNSNEP